MTFKEPRIEYVPIDMAMITDASKDCENEESQSGSHCTGAPYADQSCFDSAPSICNSGS